MKRLLFIALFASTSLLHAQTATDTVVMTTGERKPGKLLGVDAQGFSVEVQVGGGTGTVRVPRNLVSQVEFAPDATRDALIARGTVAQLSAVAALWQRFEGYTSVPKAPAGRVGLRYGSILLDTNDAKNAQTALMVFSRIEKDSWNPEEKISAKQGRLRGMVATGKADEAVAEAREIVKSSTSPEVLVEAKYILAKASDKLLRELIEENPRWEEDDRVRPERNRLYHDAIDFYLYPSLFAGAVTEPAARGLWGAIGIYKLGDEPTLAVEAAKDILILHPNSSYVKAAQEYLASLPEEQRKQDFEKEAKAAVTTEKTTDRQ
jgi:hypothetical protein